MESGWSRTPTFFERSERLKKYWSRNSLERSERRMRRYSCTNRLERSERIIREFWLTNSSERSEELRKKSQLFGSASFFRISLRLRHMLRQNLLQEPGLLVLKWFSVFANTFSKGFGGWTRSVWITLFVYGPSGSSVSIFGSPAGASRPNEFRTCRPGPTIFSQFSCPDRTIRPHIKVQIYSIIRATNC